jgi:NodT family efflux transporter outer membrane factor (OMF) lipoprotein
MYLPESAQIPENLNPLKIPHRPILGRNLLPYLLFFGLVFGFSACRVSQSNSLKKAGLPPKFPGLEKDTVSQTLPSWRNLYFDSSLSSLIDMAILQNFDYRLALQRVQIFRAGVVFNKGNNLPDLNANIGLGMRRFGNYTMDGVGNYDTRFSPNLNPNQRVPNPLPDYYLGLQSSWEADLWGKLKNRRKAAYSRFLASEAGKNLVLTTTISEVASAYFHLLALENELSIYRENIGLQEKALEAVRIQKQTGQANQLAVEIMESQLLGSREKEQEVIQLIIQAENKLHFLLGQFPKALIRNPKALDQQVPAILKAGLPSEMLQNRPDIQQAEWELAAAGADLGAAKTAFYPSLNLGAALGLQSFNAALLLEIPASVAYNGLGGLVAPLLNRRQLKAQLLQAETEQKMAYIQYEKVLVRSFTEAYNAMTMLDNIKKMIEIKNMEVALLRNAIITSGELFRTGRASYLEVNTAQKNALQSQLELVNLKKMQFQALVELYRALGGGWR